METNSEVDTSQSVKDLQHISPNTYQDLVHYFKYASSAYALVCPRPNGNKLVLQISSPVSDIQGYIARDDTKKEIIVALKGSASIIDFLTDSQITLVPLISPGVEVPSGIRVHGGFLLFWNSVAIQIIAVVDRQLSFHSDYSIVTTGHSLGGSLALLAAVALQQNFPDNSVRTYSYGAPRTGNKIFAEFVNDTFRHNAHRVVHTNDGVPTIISTSLGYHHHGVEYWQHADPASELTTVACSPNGEDPCCSASIPSRGINRAHVMYFGILVTTPFCL